MARIRTIKPEFQNSESMGRVSRDARLLFIELWTFADDLGRARAASRMLASVLFPYDDDAPDLIEGWLTELERENCIRRYEVEGTTYLEIVNWQQHQKIDHPSQSKLPVYEPQFANPREASRTFAPRARAQDLVPRTIVPRTLGEESNDSSLVNVAVDATVAAPKSRKEAVELYQSVARGWNDLAARCGLSEITDITEQRQAMIRARAEDLVETYDFPDPDAGFAHLWGLIRASPFLLGHRTRLNGEHVWKCTFNWALTKSHFTEIMEKKYEGAKKSFGH